MPHRLTTVDFSIFLAAAYSTILLLFLFFLDGILDDFLKSLEREEREVDIGSKTKAKDKKKKKKKAVERGKRIPWPLAFRLYIKDRELKGKKERKKKARDVAHTAEILAITNQIKGSPR